MDHPVAMTLKTNFRRTKAGRANVKSTFGLHRSSPFGGTPTGSVSSVPLFLDIVNLFYLNIKKPHNQGVGSL
jgi:hypothetical protein